MQRITHIGSDTFEIKCDLFDVTSLHRVDTAWRVTDSKGHVHQWFEGEKPAVAYNPSSKYLTLTLIWIKDGEEYWEDDDEPHDVGHLECKECGEHIWPGYRADDTTQYIPGIQRYLINDRSVSREEFEQRLTKAIEKEKK